jgi:SAM-dependent methyltransferase
MEKVILNLGCGFRKMVGAINVDAYECCEPDMIWDLDQRPWPWPDNSIDMVHAIHLMEHLDNWFAAFQEVARILKVGGIFRMHVPDYTALTDVGYRDHHFVFTKYSFHDCIGPKQRGANAWAQSQGQIPLAMTRHERVIYDEFIKWWIPRWFLRFASNHLVGFVHEQRFEFVKHNAIPDREEKKYGKYGK